MNLPVVCLNEQQGCQIPRETEDGMCPARASVYARRLGENALLADDVCKEIIRNRINSGEDRLSIVSPVIDHVAWVQEQGAKSCKDIQTENYGFGSEDLPNYRLTPEKIDENLKRTFASKQF